jgi:hypothetical protein
MVENVVPDVQKQISFVGSGWFSWKPKWIRYSYTLVWRIASKCEITYTSDRIFRNSREEWQLATSPGLVIGCLQTSGAVNDITVAESNPWQSIHISHDENCALESLTQAVTCQCDWFLLVPRLLVFVLAWRQTCCPLQKQSTKWFDSRAI